MANMERTSALLSPASSRFDGRHIPLTAEGMPAPEPARGAAAARNPFASFAPTAAARDTNAETKLYQVPRELIEIARARANGAEAAGKTTPLAPRPDRKLEGTLRAYAARVSSKAPRLPSVMLDDCTARDVALEGATLKPSARAKTSEAVAAAAVTSAEPSTAAPFAAAEPDMAPEPEPLLLERPSSRRPSSLQPGGVQPGAVQPGAPSPAWSQRAASEAPARAASRGWVVYAALCLMGLAASAHVLLGS